MPNYNSLERLDNLIRYSPGEGGDELPPHTVELYKDKSFWEWLHKQPGYTYWVNYLVKPVLPDEEDGLSCAAIVLKTFWKYFKQTDLSSEQANEMLGRIPNKPSFGMRSLVRLVTEYGFCIEYIEDFDFEKFAIEGEKYWFEKFRKDYETEKQRKSFFETWGDQLKQIREESERFVLTARSNPNLSFKRRAPRKRDLINALKDGCLVKCSVDIIKLRQDPKSKNKEPYRHAVLVTGFTPEGVFLYDPGSKPRGIEPAELFVEWDLFMEAWDPKIGSLTAYSLAESQVQ